MTDESLTRAIELIHSGRKEDAKVILQGLIKTDLHNIPAWFWVAETCSTTVQRIRILEACAQYNPNNPQVERALESLRGQPSQHVVEPVIQHTPEPPPGNVPPPAAIFPSSDKEEKSPIQTVSIGMDAKPPVVRKTKSKSFGTTAWLVWSMACALIIAVAGLGVYAWNSMPKDPATYRHTQPVEYYLYVPRAYKPDGTWPLFIGIHGFGGSGLDCWNLWQSYAEREGFILLCPSLSDSGGGWYQNDGENKVWASINQVQTEYRVAPRFFLAGFSAGAQFVQGFSLNYPQAIQGVAVLSAGNYYPPTPVVAGMTFLLVIGDRDDPIAIDGSQKFANALAQNGAGVDYWLLPGVGHQVTDRTKQLTIEFFRKVNGK